MNLENKFTKSSDINVCDVEEILVGLFENVANSGMVWSGTASQVEHKS